MSDHPHYCTIERSPYRWLVFGWGIHSSESPIAGRPYKVCLDAFESREEAQAAFPQAILHDEWLEPDLSPVQFERAFDHPIFP